MPPGLPSPRHPAGQASSPSAAPAGAGSPVPTPAADCLSALPNAGLPPGARVPGAQIAADSAPTPTSPGHTTARRQIGAGEDDGCTETHGPGLPASAAAARPP